MGEGEIARRRTEYGAEHLDRRGADCVAGFGLLHDFGCGAGRHCLPRHLAECGVEIDQAGTRENAFNRYMPNRPARICRTSFCSAFCGAKEIWPPSVAIGERGAAKARETGNAKSRACAENGNWFIRDAIKLRANIADIVRLERRDGKRRRREIIDQQCARKSAFVQSFFRRFPVAIGEAHMPGRDGPCDADRSRIGMLGAEVIEIGLKC